MTLLITYILLSILHSPWWGYVLATIFWIVCWLVGLARESRNSPPVLVEDAAIDNQPWQAVAENTKAVMDLQEQVSDLAFQLDSLRDTD